MYKVYQEYLIKLQGEGKYRELPIQNKSNKKYLDFSTNDYLKLSDNSEIIAAAIYAARLHGVGASGSRLLSGNNEIFGKLETTIAKDKNTEAALIFNSGFQTNIGVLSCLLNEKVLNNKPIIFFDKLNHASLYQGVFLSGAELIRYHHNDMSHLSALLDKYASINRPKFIVAETIFGMDGDILPITDIVKLADKHGAFLYLDEAHATGLFGHNGYGVSTNINLQHIPHLIMGTFSKALGCSGGYIACSEILKNYLINKAQSFIYSTANPPLIIYAASIAWNKIGLMDKERHYLFALATLLRNSLKNLGFNIGNSTTHIIPIIFGTEEISIKIKDKLAKNGIVVSCIRPPTVPPATSRIRISLNIRHTEEDLKYLIDNLKNL